MAANVNKVNAVNLVLRTPSMVLWIIQASAEFYFGKFEMGRLVPQRG
jgi:hypothetical protein